MTVYPARGGGHHRVRRPVAARGRGWPPPARLRVGRPRRAGRRPVRRRTHESRRPRIRPGTFRRRLLGDVHHLAGGHRTPLGRASKGSPWPAPWQPWPSRPSPPRPAGARLLEPRLLALGALVGLLSSVIPYSLEMAALRTLPPRVFGILMSRSPPPGVAHPPTAPRDGLRDRGQHGRRPRGVCPRRPSPPPTSRRLPGLGLPLTVRSSTWPGLLGVRTCLYQSEPASYHRP